MARLLGVGEGAVSNWKSAGAIPKKRVSQLIKLGLVSEDDAPALASCEDVIKPSPHFVAQAASTWDSVAAFMAAMPPVGAVLTAEVRDAALRKFIGEVGA